jgi:hypothetical protein
LFSDHLKCCKTIILNEKTKELLPHKVARKPYYTLQSA